ncbi:MAG: hypothetical protein HY243_15950 [Proteobacteria bacterium]|nr:hypothetical protein [Pseudomonadota bacterium]
MLDTYANLQAAIAGWLNRTDLAPRIPDFITLAEVYLGRTLRVRRMIGRSDAAIDGEFIVVPSDFAGVLSFELKDTSPVDRLAIAEPDDLAQRKSQTTDLTGKPGVYAIVGGQFQFFPAPDQSYAAELTYYKKLEPLSATTASNWLLADHPDLYLYAALVQASPYLMDDDRVTVWAGILDRLVSDIQDADKRERSSLNLAMPNRFAP